jgi:superfamily I DNA/RNA helicase
LQIHDKCIITGRAGTGKTLMGIAVGLQLLRNLKTYQSILYLTYSKFAKIRIYQEAKFHLKEQNLTKEEYKRIRVENFHSLWWQILQEYWRFIGIKRRPFILTEKELTQDSEIQYRTLEENNIIMTSLPLRVENYIKKILKRNIQPKMLDYLDKKVPNFPRVTEHIKLLKIEQNLKGRFSHDDTQYWISKLISKDRNFLNLLKNKYPVLIIDEFQDTDENQWNFIQKLNLETIIVFGDNDQRIHQYRMRSKDRINDFRVRYSNFKEVNLTILHRFSQISNPIFEEINTADYNPAESSNKLKSRAKYRCLKIVNEERDSSDSIAILCRNSVQVDEIAAFFWEKKNNIRKEGSRNSPFEKLRNLLLRLVNNADDEKLIDYLRFTTYKSSYKKEKFDLTLLKEIFPRLSNYETTNRIQIKQTERKPICIEIANLIDSHFALSLIKLKRYIVLIGKSNGEMKYDRILVYGLNFFSRKINNFGKTKWKELSKEEKREKIDILILNYENSVLFNNRIEPLSIMTIHQAKSRQFDVVIFPWFTTIKWEKKTPALNLYKENGADFFIFLNANTRAKNKFYVIKAQNYFEILPANYPNFNKNDLNTLISDFSKSKKTKKTKKKRQSATMDKFF